MRLGVLKEGGGRRGKARQKRKRRMDEILMTSLVSLSLQQNERKKVESL